ncbi:MAG: hypothetical protein AAGB35_02475 [Pseudomonadota bacterium]
MGQEITTDNNINTERSIRQNSLSRKQISWHISLLIVTLVPLLGLPLAYNIQLPFETSFLIGLGIFIGGVCHVASTYTFYVDKEARQIMNGMKMRFYLIPIIGIAFTLLAITSGNHIPIAQNVLLFIFLFHLAWLYFHYQRQNYGLLAFAAASHGKRLPEFVMRLVMIPPLAGALATFPQLISMSLQIDLPLANWQHLLKAGAISLYIVTAVILVRMAIRHRDVFAQPMVILFTLTSFGFFLPGLLIKDIQFAFWSYAIAHGLQYLLMVGIVNYQSAKRWLSMLALILFAVAGGWGLERLYGNNALFISGIALTWVHFILDARLWRMRDAAVRPYLQQRFGFIFKK